MLPTTCQMSPYLAYSMLIYIFASAYYIIQTRNIGTPFYDSLTKEQRSIKEQSASIRRKIFYNGIIIGIALIVIFRPFAECK